MMPAIVRRIETTLEYRRVGRPARRITVIRLAGTDAAPSDTDRCTPPSGEFIQEQIMNSHTIVAFPGPSITASRDAAGPPKPHDLPPIAELPDSLRPAFAILGARAAALPGHRFRLDGRPADLRRIVAAANDRRAALGLPPIAYPGLCPPARPGRS